jgi:hypothetical protein
MLVTIAIILSIIGAVLALCDLHMYCDTSMFCAMKYVFFAVQVINFALILSFFSLRSRSWFPQSLLCPFHPDVAPYVYINFSQMFMDGEMGYGARWR